MKCFSIEYRNEPESIPMKGWCINEDDNRVVLYERHLIIALLRWIIKRNLLK